MTTRILKIASLILLIFATAAVAWIAITGMDLFRTATASVSR